MDGTDEGMHVGNVDEQQTALQDVALIAGAATGSSDTFADLQRLYSRRLYSTIYKITKNREDTEDVLQETFLRAYLSLRNFEGRSSVYSWLTRIAINSALMLLRKRRHRPEVCFDLGSEPENDVVHFEPRDPCLNPEQACDQQQRCANIHRAIERLQANLREPLQSRMRHGSSLEEIARGMEITATAVKSRLNRARKRLNAARMLQENGRKGTRATTFMTQNAGVQNREQSRMNHGVLS